MSVQRFDLANAEYEKSPTRARDASTRVRLSPAITGPPRRSTCPRIPELGGTLTRLSAELDEEELYTKLDATCEISARTDKHAARLGRASVSKWGS